MQGINILNVINIMYTYKDKYSINFNSPSENRVFLFLKVKIKKLSLSFKISLDILILICGTASTQAKGSKSAHLRKELSGLRTNCLQKCWN